MVFKKAMMIIIQLKNAYPTYHDKKLNNTNNYTSHRHHNDFSHRCFPNHKGKQNKAKQNKHKNRTVERKLPLKLYNYYHFNQ